MAPNVVIRFILGVAVLLFADTAMNARDLGQWDDPANAELKNWYQALKQPDNPAATCCGEADAYWADAFEQLRMEATSLLSPIHVTTSRWDESTAILVQGSLFRKTKSNGIRPTLWVANILEPSR